MKYRNNLSDIYENSYFEVLQEFPVYIAVGHFPVNTYVGSSQMCGTLYKHIYLKPGDYVCDLYGGVFASYDGKMHSVRLELSDKHPFEKVYGTIEEKFPVEKLKKINKPSIDFQFNVKLPVVKAPNKFYGRGIDSVENI